MDRGIQFETLIGNVYEASYRPEYWPTVLEGIARVTKSDSALFMYRDNELESASTIHFHNISADAVRAFNESAGDDPSTELFMKSVPLGTATANHLLIPKGMRLEDFYGDFYDTMLAPFNMHFVGGVVLFNDQTRAMGIGIHRRKTSGPWERKHLDALTDLAPHLQRALHIHREFTRMRLREQAIQKGLDRLLIGLILFDEFMHPVYLNPIAKAALDDHPAIRYQHQKLSAHRIAETRAIYDALQKAVNASSDDDPALCSTALGIRHPEYPSPLPMLVTPVTAGSTNDLSALDARAAILISDPGKNQPIVPEALHSAYGLTTKEAEVAIAVANGMTLEAISESRDVAVSTVRSQLNSVFNKLGISRQAELVKVLLTGPFRVNF
jgi:DNA-binding NarL/FixJ family response regulator